MTTNKSRVNLFGTNPHRNLFVAIALIVLAAVLLPEKVIGGRLYDYMVAAILVVALMETAGTPGRRVMAFVFGVPAIGARLIYAESADSVRASSLVLVLSALFFILLIWNLLRDLFQGDRSTSERVFGALTAYFCIGTVFALIYAHAYLRDPGAFKIPADLIPAGPQTEAMMMPIFTYFSFVTLTTLGYGDFVPLTEQTRSLAWIEAMVGQLYLAVLVGGLVGVYFAEVANQAARATFRGSRDEHKAPRNDDETSEKGSNE